MHASISTDQRASDAVRRRRSWRFGLRTLLIGVVVLAVMFAWVGGKYRQHQLERQIIDQLERDETIIVAFVAWGDVDKYNPSVLEPFQRVINLQLESNAVLTRESSRELCHKIGQLAALKSLSIDGFHLDAKALRALHALPQLTLLSFNRCKFDSDAVQQLSGHERLRLLFFGQSEFDDADLAAMPPLPRLAILDLSHTQVTDESLKHMHKFPGLNSLGLSATAVTEEAWQALAERRPDLSIHDD